MLDFVVVMSIWLAVCMHLIGAGGDSANISYLRTLRALRPLRSLRFFSGIRVIMSSLGQSLFMVLNVTGILAFVFIIFSAVGLQLFAGALTQRCVLPEELADNTTVYMDCSVSMSCVDKTRCIKIEHEFTGDVPDEI